jgi:hypothetical protein
MTRLQSFTILLLTLTGVMPAATREAPRMQRPTTEHLRAAMEKLDWMVGKWEGTGWVNSATGRRELSYSVNVRAELGGLLLIVDGVGIGAGDGWKVTTDSGVLYAEQLLLSGPAPDVVLKPPGSAYTWQERSRGAVLRGNDAQGIERGVWVGLPFGRAECDQIDDESYRNYCRTGGEPLWSRTTISRNDENEWVQTREWQDNEPGRNWHMVFKVVLRRAE